MDMEEEDCNACPIPQIRPSGGKSFNQGGVVVGPVVVDVGADVHAAAINKERITRNVQAFFIFKLLIIFLRHTSLFDNILQTTVFFKVLYYRV
jgi:hypothetical protein